MSSCWMPSRSNNGRTIVKREDLFPPVKVYRMGFWTAVSVLFVAGLASIPTSVEDVPGNNRGPEGEG